jgi:hypothetical protein
MVLNAILLQWSWKRLKIIFDEDLSRRTRSRDDSWCKFPNSKSRQQNKLSTNCFRFRLFIASCSAFHRRSEVAINSSADDKWLPKAVKCEMICTKRLCLCQCFAFHCQFSASKCHSTLNRKGNWRGWKNLTTFDKSTNSSLSSLSYKFLVRFLRHVI